MLDAVISADFYRPLRGASELRAELAERLARAPDYEAALNLARVWMRERHFRIGVHLLRGIAEPEEAAAAYSAVAEAVLGALWPVVIADFATRHGPPPGAGAVVVAMGKLGSREMTVSSDLDLLVIYDAEGEEASDGRRPLPVTVYYARLTQALISALSAPTSEGVLYKVDMRLRPSGRSGPVATSLAAFRRYQAEEAWTWEHLALTRARVVAGPADLGEEVAAAIAAVLAHPHDAAKVLADAADMRRRLAEAHEAAAADPWEVKLGPGRMMDIELLAQTGALLHEPHRPPQPAPDARPPRPARLDRAPRRRPARNRARPARRPAADPPPRQRPHHRPRRGRRRPRPARPRRHRPARPRHPAPHPRRRGRAQRRHHRRPARRAMTGEGSPCPTPRSC